MTFPPTSIDYPGSITFDMEEADLTFQWDEVRTVTVLYGGEQIDVYQLRTITGSIPTQSDFAQTVCDWIERWQ